LLLASGL